MLPNPFHLSSLLPFPLYRWEKEDPVGFTEVKKVPQYSVVKQAGTWDSSPGSLTSQPWSFLSGFPAPSNTLCSHKGIHGDDNQTLPFLIKEGALSRSFPSHAHSII